MVQVPLGRAARAITLAALLLLPTLAGAGSFPSVDISQLEAILASPAGPVLLDVRSAEEFREGHVPGALHLPIDQLPDRIDELQPFRSRGVIAYCEHGRRATRALDLLAEKGFTNLRLLRGHMNSWRSRNGS